MTDASPNSPHAPVLLAEVIEALAPAPGDEAEVTRLLVAGEIALNEPVQRLHGGVRHDPAADRLGRDGDHVLTRGVSGGVAAYEKHRVAIDHRLDRLQPDGDGAAKPAPQ